MLTVFENWYENVHSINVRSYVFFHLATNDMWILYLEDDIKIYDTHVIVQFDRVIHVNFEMCNFYSINGHNNQ